MNNKNLWTWIISITLISFLLGVTWYAYRTRITAADLQSKLNTIHEHDAKASGENQRLTREKDSLLALVGSKGVLISNLQSRRAQIRKTVLDSFTAPGYFIWDSVPEYLIAMQERPILDSIIYAQSEQVQACLEAGQKGDSAHTSRDKTCDEYKAFADSIVKEQVDNGKPVPQSHSLYYQIALAVLAVYALFATVK